MPIFCAKPILRIKSAKPVQSWLIILTDANQIK